MHFGVHFGAQRGFYIFCRGRRRSCVQAQHHPTCKGVEKSEAEAVRAGETPSTEGDAGKGQEQKLEQQEAGWGKNSQRERREILIGCCFAGRALDRVTKQKHRQNRQKVENCPKIVFSAPPDNFRTFFRYSLSLGCPAIGWLQLLRVVLP